MTDTTTMPKTKGRCENIGRSHPVLILEGRCIRTVARLYLATASAASFS